MKSYWPFCALPILDLFQPKEVRWTLALRSCPHSHLILFSRDFRAAILQPTPNFPSPPSRTPSFPPLSGLSDLLYLR